jgi:hypothetical protein
MTTAFELEGVVHLVRPLHARAGDLDTLRIAIAGAEPAALFYHAVQCQLRSPAGEELPPDDFSAWVSGVVQDRETAERLSFAAHHAPPGDEALRAALLAVLDAVPESARRARHAPELGEFQLMATDSVRVPTGEAVRDVPELMETLARADLSVWFFHLLEQPWFAGGNCPLLAWVRGRGATRLADELEAGAHAGRSLDALRTRTIGRWKRSRVAGHVAEAAERAGSERQEVARAAVQGLVRRLRKGDPG